MLAALAPLGSGRTPVADVKGKQLEVWTMPCRGARGAIFAVLAGLVLLQFVLSLPRTSHGERAGIGCGSFDQPSVHTAAMRHGAHPAQHARVACALAGQLWRTCGLARINARPRPPPTPAGPGLAWLGAFTPDAAALQRLYAAAAALQRPAQPLPTNAKAYLRVPGNAAMREQHAKARGGLRDESPPASWIAGPCKISSVMLALLTQQAGATLGRVLAVCFNRAAQ